MVNEKLKEYFKKQRINPCETELIRREKIRKAMKGRKHTWGDKISKSNKGKEARKGWNHSEDTKNKISIKSSKTIQEKIEKEGFHWGMKNKKHSEESNLKNKEKHLGRLSNLYIDGRSYKEYPREFFEIRKEILKIDEKCVLCKSKNNLVIHHFDENKKNSNKENLVTLCRRCHRGTHSFKNNEIRKEIDKKLKNHILKR